MIAEDYVSFETAKLLKEKGFKEWCFHCYGVAVLHNGADISFDEECDLKDEGRENEIEYVEGGRLYDYGCNNRDKDAKVWAAPTLWAAMKWLREVHHLFIGVEPRLSFTDFYWITANIYRVRKKNSLYHAEPVDDYSCVACCDGDSFEDACESAIKYCLEKLI